MVAPACPIPYSYWVLPGRFLAGHYPGSLDAVEARQKVQRLLSVGLNFFLDLTSPADGLAPYEPVLRGEAAALGLDVEYQRKSIPDFSIPPADEMAAILDAIDAALASGRLVYVHCWGGIGRTGTVVGCYLVRHGMSGPAALDEIARLRSILPHPHRRSPETEEQCRMVRDWGLGAGDW